MLDKLLVGVYRQQWAGPAGKLLLSTVTAKADERWAEQIGTALMAQAGAYHVRDRADYKRVAMSMLGAVVSAGPAARMGLGWVFARPFRRPAPLVSPAVCGLCVE